ncbi:MipA/OmpV family protein [Leucothrix pacifica]|uniref:MipA/OmpV family protein n=1 Tax=Leucothrix pacifica TaxID=1247513 RepID=A0A317CA83_9GAMM|nr:MipA/OmpV family protein [Leucothrix pacifica]PWQ93280.1 hypothetical protein DKW60_17875 [Leucothrix pacifica]
MKTIMTLTATSLLIAMTPVSSAFADDKGATPNRFGVGLNLTNNPMIYDAQDGDYRAGIHLQYRGKRFNMNQDSMAYRFFNRNNFHVEGLVKYESRGFESNDYKAFEGLSDRDESADLGLRAGYETPYGTLTLDATKDISDTHEGHEADLRFGPGLYAESPSGNGNNASFGLIAGVKWQSDKTVDYYYGVKDSEATATRAAYKGKAAVTPYIGIGGQTSIGRNVTLSGSVIYKDQPDEITDSPLVNDDHDIAANLGFTYWF